MIRQSTFPNLMDTHPPGLFQIDGNLGAANGMLEALIQSRWMPDVTEIELLPALPEQWNEGSVTGVHVRGGAVVDMSWKNGKLQNLALTSKADGAVQIIAPAGQSIAAIRTPRGNVLTLKQREPLHIQNGVTYQLSFR
jgi:alpha-L-fucosidase 2